MDIEPPTTMQVPRGILLAAAGLLAAVMLLAATARLTDAGTVRDATGSIERAVTVRDLRFDDRADGSIEVLDASSGQTVAVLEPESNGFIRGSLRALVRERARRGHGAERPFRVAAWPDGRLTLEDLATGTLVDLRAFGETNAASFAALLPP
jgi:putative photosynthetic complex assembly protein